MNPRESDFGRQINTMQEQIATLEQYVMDRRHRGSSKHLLQELSATLQELHVADEELRHQHEELAAAHEAVACERQRYQELFDLAPDGYVVTDLLGVIREANRAAVAMLALPQGDLLRKPLVLFMPSHERQRFYTHLQQLRRHCRRVCWEMRLQPREGSACVVEVTVAAATDATGKPVGLRWLLRDITERTQAQTAMQEAHDALERRVCERTAYLRQMNDRLLTEIVERRHMERALRQSKERFRVVFDQAAVGIAVLCVDGTWRQANQRFCDFVGYTAEELCQQPWQQITHPDDIAAGVDHMRRLLAGEIPSYTREKRYITKQGVHVWGKVTMSLVRDATGVPQYFIDVVEDISARKMAEVQAKHAEQALRTSQQRLRQLTAHLQDMQEQERARIARELHDDLAQILTGLRFDVSWLAKQRTVASSAWKQRVQSMQSQIEDLRKSVHRIGTELRPTILDDLGLFAALEWQLQQTCQRTGLRYTLQLPDEDKLLLDAGRATALFRICQEALTNVVRHAEASAVAVQVIVQPDTLLLQVTDNGKGISPEQAMDRNTLGLLGMRERAALWGGQVTIHGTPDQGTTVTVSIPYTATAGETYDSCADRR